MIKRIIIGFVVMVSVLFLFILDPFSKPSTNNNVSNQQTVNEYIDITTHNILKTYNKTETVNIKLNKSKYQSLYKAISNNNYDFEYDDYYELNEVLSLYNHRSVDKKTSSDLLDDAGLLDANKLVKKVQDNNKNTCHREKMLLMYFIKR